MDSETATPKKESADRLTSCSNCGCARVEEFCPQCGQEQGPPVPTVPQVVAEVGDSLFGYDSRIVRTIRGLLRPGFLTIEYLRGRRAAYITPFRLYLLVSAIYLFLNVGLTNLQEAVTAKPAPPAALNPAVPVKPAPVISVNNTSAHISLSKDDDNEDAKNTDKNADKNAHNEDANKDADTKDGAKETAEAKSDAATPDGEKIIQEAEKRKSEKGKSAGDADDAKGGFQRWADRHETLATLLVLPLFAWLLYRAYRESHPLFLAHLVFALHIQCISYILAIALVKAPSALNDVVHALHIPILGFLTGIFAGVGVVAKFTVLFFYLGKAIRAVYGEEKGKARRTTIFLFLMLVGLTVIQGIVVWMVDTFVPGATYARFLPD